MKLIVGIAVGVCLGLILGQTRSQDDPFADETPEEKAFWEQMHKDAQLLEWEQQALNSENRPE